MTIWRIDNYCCDKFWSAKKHLFYWYKFHPITSWFMTKQERSSQWAWTSVLQLSPKTEATSLLTLQPAQEGFHLPTSRPVCSGRISQAMIDQTEQPHTSSCLMRSRLTLLSPTLLHLGALSHVCPWQGHQRSCGRPCLSFGSAQLLVDLLPSQPVDNKSWSQPVGIDNVDRNWSVGH